MISLDVIFLFIFLLWVFCIVESVHLYICLRWKCSAVLVWVLQRIRTNRVYIQIYIKTRFIIEIGSHNYGGWEVPQYAFYKLEDQKSCLYNSVQVWIPTNQQAVGISHSPSLKAWEPEVLMSMVSRRWISQLKQEEQIHPLFTFLFYSNLQQLVRVIFFPWSTNSNADNTPTEMTF